jgi:hypothetical protein
MEAHVASAPRITLQTRPTRNFGRPTTTTVTVSALPDFSVSNVKFKERNVEKNTASMEPPASPDKCQTEQPATFAIVRQPMLAKSPMRVFAVRQNRPLSVLRCQTTMAMLSASMEVLVKLTRKLTTRCPMGCQLCSFLLTTSLAICPQIQTPWLRMLGGVQWPNL